jgi:LEA14-like dessication related protein
MHLSRSLMRPVCLLALTFALTGCAGLNAQRPTAALRNVNVTDVTVEGVTADFLLDVANPNAFAIPVSAAEYKLGLGNVQVVDGKLKPTGSLPANGTLPVNVPVRLTFEKLLAAEQALVKGGGIVPYSLDGALLFGSGTNSLLPSNMRVPLKYSGELNLRDALSDPKLFTSPTARRLIKSVLGNSGIPGGLLSR